MVISVVLPVFDDEAHVGDAVRRVLAQEGVDIELVVVDDGSTDGSREAVRAAAGGDERVRLVALSQNGGVARARRHGVEQARGDWIWFVDSDDDWGPDSAARLAAAAAESPGTDIVVAGARYTFESGRTPTVLAAPAGPPISGHEAFSRFLGGEITGHLWNKLFRRDLLLGIDFTPARVQSDLAMVAQAVAAADQVAFLPVPVYEYRVRSNSIITTRPRRAESLQLIASAVETAAERVRPPAIGTDDYRYFVTRRLVLSGLKDAVLGPYTAAERAGHVARLRRRLGARELALLARRRDLKGFALAVSARVSLRAHRAVLAVGDR